MSVIAPAGEPYRTDRFLQAAADLVRRFPVALVGVLLWTGFTLADAHLGEIYGEAMRAAERHILIAAFALFAWGTAGRLMAERGGWSSVRTWAVMLGGAVGTYAAAIVGGTEGHEMLLLAAALALLIVTAAGPGRAGFDGRFWTANAAIVVHAGIAMAAALLLLGGTMLLLVGVKQLLGLDIDEWAFENTAILCVLGFGPALALAALPQADDPAPLGATELRVLTFLSAGIAVPLCTAYLLLVYAQFGRFLLAGSVPANETGWLVSLFGTAGIVTWMMATGNGETGRWPHVALYRRLFFPTLAVPAGVLAYALYLRVAAYGWTPERTVLGLVVVWFALSILWWATRRWTGLGMRALVVILAAGSAITSIGPLSLSAVTVRSQLGRLETALADAGLLRDGVLTIPAQGSGLADIGKVASPLEAIRQAAGGEYELPWPGAGTVADLAQATGADLQPAPMGRDLVQYGYIPPFQPGLEVPEGTRFARTIWLDTQAGNAAILSAAYPVDIRLAADGNSLLVDLGGAEAERIGVGELTGRPTVPDERGEAASSHPVTRSGPAGTITFYPLSAEALAGEDGDTPQLRTIELLVLFAPSGP